jgi:hypothetical protein
MIFEDIIFKEGGNFKVNIFNTVIKVCLKKVFIWTNSLKLTSDYYDLSKRRNELDTLVYEFYQSSVYKKPHNIILIGLNILRS